MKTKDPTYCGTYAAIADCSKETVEEGRKKSHDMLLELTGDERIGPVSWWGIEDDSGDEYLLEVAGEEVDQVKEMLEQLGFTKEQLDGVDVDTKGATYL